MATIITDQNFEELVVKSGKPVLLDFGADLAAWWARW
jgi:thioredoxin-like negative regulator of GroEL